MVVKRGISTVCILLIVFSLSILSITPVKAESISTSWIDASFEFSFLNGSYLDIRLRLDVHNITVYNRIYGADEIREVYNEEGAAFRLKVFDYSMEILGKVFKGCKINLDIPREDASSLNVPADEDPYNPPVIFYIDGNISLGSDFFGCDIDNIGDLVNGLLDMGGRIRYSFTFFAPASWNISYVFNVPDYMSPEEVNGGTVSIDGKKVTWKVKNWGGKDWKSKEGYMILKEADPTSLPDKENISANITFDMSKIDATSVEIYLDILSLDISDIVNYPDFVEGVDIVPSDGVRLFLESGLISPMDLQNLLDNKWSQFEDNFIESLGKNISLSSCMDVNTTTNCSSPYNTSHMDSYPPLGIIAHGDVERLLDNLSTRSVLGIIYSGGAINVDKSLIDLSKLRYPFEAKIVLPNGKNYSWNESSDINATLSYDNAPRYTTEKKERIVEIYVKSMDLDLIDLLTGKSNVVSQLDVKDRFLIYRVYTNELLSLPHWIDLDILNSDLLRLFIEEKVIDEGMNGFIEERKNLSRDLLCSVIKQNGLKIYLDENELKDSLVWDGNIMDMDDYKPVNISFFSITTKKSGFSFSLIPFSLTIKNESFECFAIPEENITYRFIFPKGVKVECNDSLGISRIGSLEDGRKYIEIEFSRDCGLVSSTVYYSLELSPLMVFLIFLPLIAMFLIITAIVTILILLNRRRRIRPRAPEYREVSEEQTDNFR